MEYTSREVQIAQDIIISAYKKKNEPKYHDLMAAYDTFMGNFTIFF